MSERGSSLWRQLAWGVGCDRSLLISMPWLPGVRLTVDKRAREAFVELAKVFVRHGYQVRPLVTGAYVCRKITGGSSLSAHAYGIAVDVNWDTNPYMSGPNRKLVTDIPMPLIYDVYRIRTKEGRLQVFRWGGDWDGRPETSHSNYDSMHFEVIVSPEELSGGVVSAVPMDLNDPRTWPVLRVGARGQDVVTLQRLLNVQPDGIFGSGTLDAVRAFQITRRISPDGVVGKGTWTLLVNGVSVVGSGEVAPHKGLSG